MPKQIQEFLKRMTTKVSSAHSHRQLLSIIMGDGDTTISAAAKNVWMLIKRAMCYAHVKMNLKKKLQPKVMDPVRETISKDVALLQLASSTANSGSLHGREIRRIVLVASPNRVFYDQENPNRESKSRTGQDKNAAAASRNRL
uniref:Transposase n=1 Tax=Ditylenchus dipsaci TaxID=166011 RepID=A0A915E5S6_9BILA